MYRSEPTHRKRTWITLSPLESFISALLIMILVGISFGLGMHYGQELGEGGKKASAIRDTEAMASIERYFKDHPPAFHFQKMRKTSENGPSQYLYTADSPAAKPAADPLVQLTRKSPVHAPPGESPQTVDTDFLETMHAPDPFVDDEPAGDIAHAQQPVAETAFTLSAATPAAAPAQSYVIQVESFDEEARALKKQAALKEKGVASFIDRDDTATLPYRLYVGPYGTKDAAKEALDRLRALTRPDIFIRRYERPVSD